MTGVQVGVMQSQGPDGAVTPVSLIAQNTALERRSANLTITRRSQGIG